MPGCGRRSPAAVFTTAIEPLSWTGRTWRFFSAFLEQKKGPSVVVTQALLTCELGQEWRITFVCGSLPLSCLSFTTFLHLHRQAKGIRDRCSVNWLFGSANQSKQRGKKKKPCVNNRGDLYPISLHLKHAPD